MTVKYVKVKESDLVALRDKYDSLHDRVEVAEAEAARAERTPADPAAKSLAKSFGTPHVREGEDPLTSRSFYIARLASVVTAPISDRDNKAAHAKMEVDDSVKLQKALEGVYGRDAEYPAGSLVVPLSWAHMPDQVRKDRAFDPMKKAMAQAVVDVDPGFWESQTAARVESDPDMRRLFKKATMSYLDQTTGGALVAPPEFGDLIPILKNKAVLPNIGAQQMSLPPQGTVIYPRQTGVSDSTATPEGVAGSETNPTFDDIELSAKQYIGLVRVSNQLLRFSPGIAEAAIRTDMVEQAGLRFDKDGIDGVGGPNRVTGIINQAGVGLVVAKSTGATGDTLTPPDCARLLRKAMQRNSDVKTWVMLPDMWLGITEFRADGTTPGDSSGNYLFQLLRDFKDDFGDVWRGRKVVTSNQVSRTRDKGGATNLSYIIGVNGEDVIVGMHGALAIDANPYETNAYAKNQTLMRTILFGDVKVKRGAGVVYMDDLIVPNLDA